MIRTNIYGTGGYGTLTNNGSVESSPANDDLRRPKPVFFWTNVEVMKWLKRHGEEFYELYGAIFLENDITGRSLIRINEETLARMGIENAHHREQIARIFLKLKLKSDMLQFKEHELKAHDNTAVQSNTLPKASSQNNSNNSKTFANYIR